MDMVNFIKDEEGTSMAEYALLLGLITVAIVTVVTALGTRISGAISKAVTAIPS
jgi:Flp pilus assembly pilin Flp